MEESIENEIFQLYGEDLRCLDSGQPMMHAFHYDEDIQKTIQRCKRNAIYMLENKANHPMLKRYIIRRIGENKFIYDKTITVDDVFETTEETDIHKIFKSFDRTKNMYRIFASTKIKTICIVWSHAVMDGVTGSVGAYTLFGKAIVDIEPIQQPPFILQKYYAAETFIKLRDFLRDSHLTTDMEWPRFHTTTMKLTDIKTIAKKNQISFPATACALYVTQLFNGLPQSVKYLKVFVSVYIKNENRFNNYSVIPIIVYRDNSSPVEVNRLLSENKTMLFGFHELFRTNLLTNLKSRVDYLKPDVIFTSMKNTEDTGHAKLNRILVYNYSSSAKIYACGLQCGPDNFYINSSIRTSALTM
jgi:hypothetical protein